MPPKLVKQLEVTMKRLVNLTLAIGVMMGTASAASAGSLGSFLDRYVTNNQNGYYQQGYNSGFYPQSYNSGFYPQSYNSGFYPQSYNSGFYPQSYNSGFYPQSYNSGYYPSSAYTQPYYGSGYNGYGNQYWNNGNRSSGSAIRSTLGNLLNNFF